jgi:Ni,Fe-hydrogenase III small subunit
LTGAQAEGSTIPQAVPVEGVVPEIQEAAGAAPEPAEVASGGAPAMVKRSAMMYYQSQT